MAKIPDYQMNGTTLTKDGKGVVMFGHAVMHAEAIGEFVLDYNRLVRRMDRLAALAHEGDQPNVASILMELRRYGSQK